MEIAFNAKYLIDVLNILDGEKVTLELNSATQPGKIAVGNYLHVIMPMYIIGSDRKQVNTEGEEVEPPAEDAEEESAEETGQ